MGSDTMWSGGWVGACAGSTYCLFFLVESVLWR